MPMYSKKIPVINKLYWKCIQCKQEHEWPRNRAAKYCNKSCQNAHYYQQHKNK